MIWNQAAVIHWKGGDTERSQSIAFEGGWLHVLKPDEIIRSYPASLVDHVEWFEPTSSGAAPRRIR